MNESELRKLLGERVRAIRRRKYKTIDAARTAAGIARGTWEKAERGDPIKDFSWSSIEAALDWESGYAEKVLSGIEPRRATLSQSFGLSADLQRSPQNTTGFDAYLRSLEDRLDDLESRVAHLEGGEEHDGSASTSEPLSVVPVELPAAAKEGLIEESGEFNT